MTSRLIKPVQDNKIKQHNYSALISKYNEAVENGYYGEAELIVYAFLEDRLRAFIYYSDLIDTFNSNNINENAEALYHDELNIKDITSKISIVRKSLSVCSMKTDDMSPFEKDLGRRYNAVIKIREMRKALDQINGWCRYRNEVIHALFNKDMEDLRIHYREHIESGMKLARYIDEQVKALKKA